MKICYLVTALSLLSALGCTSTNSVSDQPTATKDAPLSPFEAVVMANEFADEGVSGIASSFSFKVKSVFRLNDELFLNSHEDDAHPFNLSIRVYPKTAQSLKQQFGQDLQAALVNKQVVVTGVPQRQKISLECNDIIAKHYYQTHLKVLTARQLTFSD